MQGERKTLTQLSVPICLETLFYMLSGMVDTLMLSSVSDQAVGAVGTANTYEDICIRVVNSASLIFGNFSKVCEANSCQVDKRWHLHPCCFIPLSSLT